MKTANPDQSVEQRWMDSVLQIEHVALEICKNDFSLSILILSWFMAHSLVSEFDIHNSNRFDVNAHYLLGLT